MIDIDLNLRGYDVIAVLKDIEDGTGIFKRKLIFLDFHHKAMNQMDCFDIITKSLQDYDLVAIIVYFKKPKLVKLTIDRRTKRFLAMGKIGTTPNIRFPALYVFDFPKGTLIKTELVKVY